MYIWSMLGFHLFFEAANNRHWHSSDSVCMSFMFRRFKFHKFLILPELTHSLYICPSVRNWRARARVCVSEAILPRIVHIFRAQRSFFTFMYFRNDALAIASIVLLADQPCTHTTIFVHFLLFVSVLISLSLKSIYLFNIKFGVDYL